jgi:YVTN family beta-propeller protein
MEVVTIPVGSFPIEVAITPDGSRAYVANFSSNTVSVIDTDPASGDFNTVVDTVPVGIRPWGLAITPDPIEALIEDVEELLTGGILSGGQANSLGSKLENILDKLEKGQTQPAINQLNAFINQVLALVDGVLTPEEGQDLVDAAQSVIDQLTE